MKSLKKLLTITRVSLANTLTYRVTIITRFVFYTLFIYIFMSLWRTIYRDSNLHGYVYAQIVWYLIITEFISFVMGSDYYTNMNDEVKTGAIAYQIGRPVHYVFYQFANALGQICVNGSCFGLLAIVLGFVFTGGLSTFQIVAIPVFLLSLALSMVLQFFILTLIGLSAFVFEDNYGIFLIYQKSCFMLGMLLPMEFLPAQLQAVARWLPFSYVYWAPAGLFVNYSKSAALEILPRQAGWTAVAVAVTLLCYRRCVKRLQVNGG